HRGEAEAAALAVLLGGEERFEDAGACCGVHANAGVRNRDRGGRARQQLRRHASVGGRRPPLDMASRALSARLTRTCSNDAGSTFTRGRSGVSAVTSSTSSLI